MNTNLLEVIDSFAGLKVLVLGEAMLDSYLAGPTERLCREAPVPVVSVTNRVDLPGGAANTAVNVQSLGAEVTLLSVIGDDAEGAQLCQALETYGVSTEHLIVHPNRSTLAKQRVIAETQLVVRFDQGTTEPLDESVEIELIDRMAKLFCEHDALIISDYDYGILSPRVLEALKGLQTCVPRVIMLDSKRLPLFREVGVTAVKPNYAEALHLLGLEKPSGRDASEKRVEQMMQQGERILEISGAQIAAITVDQDGALIFERERSVYRTYARPAPHSRAAGAGDTFVAAFALALAAGAHTANAAELASAAASVAVSKDGTSACQAEELRLYFSTEEKYVTDVFQLAARMAAYRAESKRIVFTNGCFDILHRGHITYLNQAKAQGDILIVGLNSDSSVRRLKGPNRPINTLEDRAQVLAALSCVDHIVAFDGNTPHELIRQIRPDVFIKGGDYTRETLPEAPLVEALGGEVKILPYMQDRSTTGIIEKIRELYVETPPGKVDRD